MVTFDDVLPTLVRICEATPAFASVERACAVRDLQGRVRLIVKGGADLDGERLASTLVSALGPYFVGPIWRTTAGGEEGRLATKALEVAEPWAPKSDGPTGDLRPSATPRWRRIERRLSKQAWLEERAPQPPWALGEGPAIVTFYSFKGGVGRTTALVSCAWQLAQAGKRATVIDLDLEAPGLGALLGGQAERGAIDFIVDFLATGSRDVSAHLAPTQALGPEEGGLVDVVPAGTLSLQYIEKLARLDFLGSQDWSRTDAESPVASAVTALLHAVRAQRRPDFILIDSRAGLHDLAGLSLHGLAHVDVIVSRASDQAYQGLDLTIHALSLRKKEQDLLSLVVHSFAPPDLASPAAVAEADSFRRRVYDAFCEHVYGDEAPDIEATDVAHSPIVIPADDALAHPFSLLGVRERLFAQGYRALHDRILELCGVPEGEE